jgi:hypothetical protein
MKIIQLTAENVKRLKVVDITASAGLNQVTGRNGSGKSSVLDSIWWALAGGKNIQAVPVRKGAEKAKIRLDLGAMIVERTFTAAGGTSVIVMNPEGVAPGTPDKKLPRYGSPQETLDAILGELSFDPLAFTRKKPREQFDELRKISKLSVDIDALNAQNDADFKRRTDINRDAKAKRARAEGIAVPADTPAFEVDESALVDQIQSAGEHNAAIEQRKARREQALRDAADKRAQVERLDTDAVRILNIAANQIQELKDRIAVIEKESKLKADESKKQAAEAARQASDLQRRIDTAEPLPAPVDVSVLRVALNTAKATNAAVQARKQRDAIASEANVLEAEAKALTDRMAAREAQKTAAIQTAQMPVEGLGFGDGLVTFNGLPYDQASGAEQLRVSASIAMAANPQLRVIRIKDGGLLDDGGMKLLAELAAEKDYQVWVETCHSAGEIGVVFEMEDGAVKVAPTGDEK